MSHGPIQYFVFAFPGNQFRGGIVPALRDVTAKGLIRIVDVAFAMKDADGNLLTMEINELGDEEFNTFSDLIDHTEGVLAESDILELAAEIPPNNSAALLVFEHVWATELASAIRDAKGVVLTQGFVPQELVQAVEAARANG